MQNAAHVPDAVERAIAEEMARLVAHDAVKFPVSGAKVHGAAAVPPVEEFDEDALNKARMEILLEQPEGELERARAEFEQAWDAAHSSNQLLPGLVGYEADAVDEQQLLAETFDVSSSTLLLPHPSSLVVSCYFNKK
jgi:pre-mRNA-splicing factor CDC5/CEF1